MGLRFSAAFSAVADTAAQDLFELNVASDRSVILHGLELANYSDFGDAQAEILSLLLIKNYTGSGSGGSTTTPVHLQGSATAASTFEINNTTLANTGTPLTIWSTGWNIQVPLLQLWTPELRPELKASSRLVLRATAPADSITLNGTLYFEEIGG